MFKALNPYQLLRVANGTVKSIRLGRTPELTQFFCTEDGGASRWRSWDDFIRVPGKRGPMGKFLLECAEYVRDGVGRLKPAPSSPWDPTGGEDELAWLLPYLTVTDLEELLKLLDTDIEMIRRAVQNIEIDS